MSKKGLDTFSEKRPVGRPARMRPSEIAGRSYNLRLQFGQIWDTVGHWLIEAQTDEDVLYALDLAGQYWRNEFGRIPWLILKIVRDPKFPKKRRQQQINFLADSLAAWGTLSPRRSRDICEQERRKEKQEKMDHHILRREFYVECSCGYKGPALNNACRNCGAEIPYYFDSSYFESE
ncbi:MAG TPA: hypothetical protein VFB23_09900 [Candidatus Acidoferrales bacterium]|nr:hypothetical protein [Candidatus Acidoferrales bacterium]